jgi:hypothetical protein
LEKQISNVADRIAVSNREQSIELNFDESDGDQEEISNLLNSTGASSGDPRTQYDNQGKALNLVLQKGHKTSELASQALSKLKAQGSQI